MAQFGVTVDETTKQKNNPLNKFEEKKRKFLEHEENEKNVYDILQTGQENRKRGIKAVKEQVQDELREEEKKKNELLNRFDMRKRFANSYKMELAKALSHMLELLDWIKGWRIEVVVTDGSPITIKASGQSRSFYTKDGILLVLITVDGRVFHKGMLVTQEPALDYAKLYDLALQVENTLDKEKGLLLDGSQNKVNSEHDKILDKYGRKITSGSEGTHRDDSPSVPLIS